MGHATAKLMDAIRRGLRTRGWELRPTDPDRSLGEHLWFLFPYLGINCVLDVGAGGGDYGDFLRRNGYRGHIISFEPVAASFRMLAQRSARDPRWRACPYALGGETTTAEINVTKDVRYASFLRPSEHSLSCFPPSAIERTETVEVRRLDDVVDGLVAGIADPRIYVKLTTQGWDFEVLRGAERCLAKVVGLQAEVSVDSLYEGAVDFTKAIGAFNRAGFAVAGIFDRPHHHGFRLAEFDCTMVRPPTDRPQVVRRW